jgi:hypothetical protein
MHWNAAIILVWSAGATTSSWVYSRIDEKDGEVCCEPNIYTDLECSIRRQSKVEEQEGTLYDPMHKVIIDFFNEQGLDNFQLLYFAQRSHMPGLCQR